MEVANCSLIRGNVSHFSTGSLDQVGDWVGNSTCAVTGALTGVMTGAMTSPATCAMTCAATYAAGEPTASASPCKDCCINIATVCDLRGERCRRSPQGLTEVFAHFLSSRMTLNDSLSLRELSSQVANAFVRRSDPFVPFRV